LLPLPALEFILLGIFYLLFILHTYTYYNFTHILKGSEVYTNIKNTILPSLVLAGIILGVFGLQMVSPILIGIRPRDIDGLSGILLSPFFHIGWSHVWGNLPPLVILGSLVTVHLSRMGFVAITLLLIGLSGALVWALGRSANHVGASGLVFAYFGYLLGGLFYGRGNFLRFLTALVAISLYWYLIPSIFRDFLMNPRISWEGHLFGCIAGIIIVASTHRLTSKHI
jgi:membrane associated rhomboid family serine protease